MDTTIYSLLCLFGVIHISLANSVISMGPNITHSTPFHFDATKFGHQECKEGDLLVRPDGLLKCCYKKGGRLACKEVDCGGDSSVIEDVKVDFENDPSHVGRACEDFGLVFRGKNNLLYCCTGIDLQRICTRIPCPRAGSFYDGDSYENTKSNYRISRRISTKDERYVPRKKKESRYYLVDPPKVPEFALDLPSIPDPDDFFGYLH